MIIVNDFSFGAEPEETTVEEKAEVLIQEITHEEQTEESHKCCDCDTPIIEYYTDLLDEIVSEVGRVKNSRVDNTDEKLEALFGLLEGLEHYYEQ